MGAGTSNTNFYPKVSMSSASSNAATGKAFAISDCFLLGLKQNHLLGT